jgi:hypothetical protein
MYLSNDHARIRSAYIRKRTARLPRGKEVIHNNCRSVYISEYPGKPGLKRKRLSLRKKAARVIMAQISERQELEREIPVIDSFLEAEKSYKLRKSVMDREFYEGLSAFADSNPYEKPKYAPEFKGIKYRSKTELNIAQLIDDAGFEFLYEPQIFLGTNKTYPDFVFYVPEAGRCFIWEHFGLWNDKDYRRDAQKKTESYLSRGLLPGRDVIFTYESDEIPFDVYAARNQMNAVIMTNVI